MSAAVDLTEGASTPQTTAPVVSVIICTYNAGDYLCPAIRSILAQTFDSFEVIVVDDGSTDGSVDHARQMLGNPRIRWVRQGNAGKPAAMNTALQQVGGEFYAIQDADDLSHPRRLERLVTTMREDPKLAAVYSGHDIILRGRRMAPRSRPKGVDECRRDIARMAMPAHDPTGMYRMSMVRDLRYDPALRIGEGLDYILRVGERHPMRVVGECLYSYRIHWSSLTRSDPVLRERLVVEVLRRACKRRGIPFDRCPAHDSAGRRNHAATADNNLCVQFIESILDLRRAGEQRAAVSTALQCSRLHPLDVRYHKALVYSLSPVWLIRRLRQNGTL